MERELKLGDKIIVLDDRNGALDRTIDPQSGRPLPDTSRDKTVEAARLPPEGLPNTSDPLGAAHAEGQLYGAVYDGRISPVAFAVGWTLASMGFLFAIAVVLDDERIPVLGYLIAALILAAWASLFTRSLRRMRERKRRLDARVPPRRSR